MTRRQRIAAFLEGEPFGYFIMGVILFNAAILGLKTGYPADSTTGALLIQLDRLCLGIFVAEILAKIYARGAGFLRSGWNVFDLVIVGISLVPATPGFSVLRALRILRVLRVLSVVPTLRRVVEGFLSALPGMGSVFLLMGVIFYIGSVMATNLFAPSFPEWFGSLERSAYTLFQIMTLESWSMGIVRPVMEVYPLAWAFFLPFILLTTFVVVNLVVGLIVNSMQEAHQEESNAATEDYRDEVLGRLGRIEEQLAARQPPRD